MSYSGIRSSYDYERELRQAQQLSNQKRYEVLSFSAEVKQPKKKEGKMKELLTDAKTFVKEHKSVFYWVAIVALADHFVFKGAFREKLKEVVNKLIGKLEKQVEGGN